MPIFKKMEIGHTNIKLIQVLIVNNLYKRICRKLTSLLYGIRWQYWSQQ